MGANKYNLPRFDLMRNVMKLKVRPTTNYPKNISIKFRVDDAMHEKFNFCVRVLHINNSEVIRVAITEIL